jgi:type IV pilus assembly protein PilM
VSGSIWKKEFSLRKKDEETAAEEAHVAAPVEPVAAEPAADQAVDQASVAPLPEVTGDYGWLTANFDPNEVPEKMPTVSAPQVPAAPASAAPVEASTAPDLPAVVAPAVVVPAPEAVAAQPESSSADSTDAKTPFWKKELKVKRGPKEAESAKEPKATKAPKEKKVKAEKQPKQPKEPKEKQAPFWKREVSFGKSKDEAVAEQAPQEAGQPKEKQPPFWKREVSFGKSKDAAGEQAVKAPKAKRVKGEKLAKAPKKQKAPTQGKGGLVGLKIGASQIAAARVANSNGSPELLQVARIDLPDGVVVGGELRDIEGLASALKELFAKHKLPKRGVRLGIANNRIGVRTFEITGIDDPRQLANAIRFRAQETLPIPLEEAVLDWQVLSERVDPESGQAVRRVLLVVAYRELVDRYVLACRQAGIKLAGIDLEAFAMLRALSAPPAADAPEPTGAQVVVNVGHDRSTFAVSDGRHCEFTRVLGWGGQSLSVAIARALDMTPSEATPIKHALSLVATYAPPDGVSVESMNTARDAVNRELQSFARELVSSLRFYQNQPGSLGIGELVLTGGTAHLPGFADELNRMIGVRVRVGDPLNRVVIPKKFREPDEYSLGSLTVAIGLGIED